MAILNNGIALDTEELKFQDGSIGVRISWRDIRVKDSKMQHIDVNFSRSEDKEDLRTELEKVWEKWKEKHAEAKAESFVDWVDYVNKTCDYVNQNKKIIEEFNNKQKETELEQAWEKWKEKYCQNTKKQSADEELEKKEQKTSFVEMDPVQWTRIRHLQGYGFDHVDFSDHKTLNWFFRECLWCESTDENFHAQRFIRGMENSLKFWKNTGYVTLYTILYYLGVLNEFTESEKTYFCKFEWDKEHPFDYQLTVTRPDEEDDIEYYAVFSSAPVHK